jgi:hypothetical protein
MKRTITLLLTILTLNSFSQSINVQLDTTQTLQDSDAGSVAYADVDLDGDNDLLIAGFSSSQGISTTLYENDGSGNFTAMSQPAIVNVYAGAAEFADVENDGDMDLLITGNTGSPAATANLYINDGLGSYSLFPSTPFEPSNNGDIDFGDIDGDNDLDLIMTGKDASGNVFSKLYTNNGTGSFTLVTGTIFTGVYMSSTEFIDVDNDGDLDLLMCGADSSDVSTTKLYENNGSGIFNLVTGTPFDNAQFGDIAFGDTDNDGDQDILIVGQNDSSQYIAKLYINTGTSFSLHPNTPFPGTFLHSSSFTDFNNDGKLDLLHIGNALNGLIGHIYENQGSNNFVLADSTLSGSYNGSNIVADLNGDNKMDIVTTGTSFTFPLRAPKIYFNQSTTVSVNELHDDVDFIIFPNPSSGLINVKINSASPTDIEIYDIMGRAILSDTFFGNIWNTQLNDGSGIYLMRLRTDKQVYTSKITLN